MISKIMAGFSKTLKGLDEALGLIEEKNKKVSYSR
jgi:hypothetical protein